MIEEKEITCIVCPLGCKILVSTKGKSVRILGGNKCKKGVHYAIYEALDPQRMLTSSILVSDGEWPLLSVKTTKPIPKKFIFSVLKEMKQVVVQAPVHPGDVIIQNVAGLDVDVIATKTIKQVISRN